MKRHLNKMNQSGGKLWKRGEVIAQGSCSTIYFASPRLRRSTRHGSFFPSLMVVKSAEISESTLLQKEAEILTLLQECPHILRCYGNDFTIDNNGGMTYHILLEYASGRTLKKLIENSKGNGLPKSKVRHYTKSILLGLSHIQIHGYVHHDINPENILLVPTLKKSASYDFDAKIADFEYAKKIAQNLRKSNRDGHLWIGTLLYMSPKVVKLHKQEPPSDIWAIGRVVAEMVSWKPAWSCESDEDVDLLYKIGSGLELPEIPSVISNDGKEFLRKCFVTLSKYRWTAEMLLFYPFVVAVDNADMK